jgi:predicted membrane-bound spermidine synthase
MRKRLLWLSFIEGAAVMAAEVCGAKLLAPVFGGSLFVWASVMGITLSALSAGYFFGGWLSDRSVRKELALFRVLSAAALFLLFMPVCSHYLVPRLSYLPFLAGVVSSTLLLLFFPVFLLGASSPLFVWLQTRNGEGAGRVSGTVYAISTAGGILATFLTGFWLIPGIGLQATLLLFGSVLFLSNILVLKVWRPGQGVLLLLFAYLNFQGLSRPEKLLMASDSMLGHLEVRDIAVGSPSARRLLSINDIIQTEMDLAGRHSLSPYVRLIDTLVPVAEGHENALVLGLGGGLAANLLAGKNYRTDGVELDERIIEAARTYFYLSDQVSTFYEDARYFLNHCDRKYSLVLVDIFKGEEQPSHVLTRESLKLLKQRLADSALLLINWHGYTRGEKGLGTAILHNTLRDGGFEVRLCSYSGDEDHRNILFVAGLSPELPHLPFELDEPLPVTSLVNTDDLPLLEKYNARANKAWRLNYLRYYQAEP